MRVCTVEGCRGKHYARGWCARHYQAWRRNGRPVQTPPATHRTAVTPRRFV